MKFYTSYFYQVRFFPPNLIPLSTACSDPKWFHDNKGLKWQFKDKRGVLNGLRAEPFVPGQQLYGLCRGPEYCETINPQTCDFLRAYKAQLDALYYDSIMYRFQQLHDKICHAENFDNVDFALLVHEAPTNQCSERIALQNWFLSHDVPISEWSKDQI